MPSALRASVDRYTPSGGQRRFLTTRDRTCRHPGCHVSAGWADLDHVIPHGAGGATDCANLCCLCRRHHRLKTHADGWTHTLSDDGVLTVITPSGVTRVTRPPGWRVLTESPDPPVESAPVIEDPPPF
ncbi:HNH endonuclease signature motif containing protein [Blastococcus sp. TF02-9]|uniref:HNH endonuclease signature motif containing protein n=1 Tax=Blastococcus sp. TF02-09 TaxID=2250576 RepID=UPI0011BF80CC|nr:HNH endonuclease signature motif containing protein [Blastococcus sp. TF02-9]